MRTRAFLKITALTIALAGITGCGSDTTTATVTNLSGGSTPNAPAADTTSPGTSPLAVSDDLVNAAKTRLGEVAQAAGAVIEGPELDLEACPLPSVVGQMATNGLGDGGGVEASGIRIDENNATELGCVARTADGDTLQVWGLVSFDISQTQNVNEEMSDRVEVTPPAELGGRAYHGATDEGATAIWIRGGIGIIVAFRIGDGSEGTDNSTGTDPAQMATPDSEAALRYLYANIPEWLQQFVAFDPYSVDVVVTSST